MAYTRLLCDSQDEQIADAARRCYQTGHGGMHLHVIGSSKKTSVHSNLPRREVQPPTPTPHTHPFYQISAFVQHIYTI